jgi:hypothetical protein
LFFLGAIAWRSRRSVTGCPTAVRGTNGPRPRAVRLCPRVHPGGRLDPSTRRRTWPRPGKGRWTILGVCATSGA